MTADQIGKAVDLAGGLVTPEIRRMCEARQEEIITEALARGEVVYRDKLLETGEFVRERVVRNDDGRLVGWNPSGN